MKRFVRTSDSNKLQSIFGDSEILSLYYTVGYSTTYKTGSIILWEIFTIHFKEKQLYISSFRSVIKENTLTSLYVFVTAGFPPSTTSFTIHLQETNCLV